MGETYLEVDKERAWKRHGKGKGLRWQIQRDLVAILSRLALTSTQIQDCMVLTRGLSHKKTRELIDELKQTQAIEELKTHQGYVIRASELGVSVYLRGNRRAIPVRVVQEALSLASARELEEYTHER